MEPPCARRCDLDPETRRERHADRWKAGNTRSERTAVSGLIFAAVIFFNVVQPYHETAGRRADLARFESEQRAAQADLAQLNAFETRLDEIARTVERAPWRQHQEALIARFASGAVASEQMEADDTVRRIAAQARETVLPPLAEAVRMAPSGGLSEQPARMQARIDDWEESKLGRRWFQTLASKEGTVVELGSAIEALQRDVRQVLEQLQQDVSATRIQAELAQAQLTADIEVTKHAIQQALDDAIPAWARGLVSVDRMVPAFPWILSAIALYLVGNALVAARHYHGMADAAGWSRAERSDPLLSSLWTLTWRERAGTALTLATYLGVLSGLGAFLARTVAPLESDDSARWLPAALPLLAAAAAVVATLRERTRDEPGTSQRQPGA